MTTSPSKMSDVRLWLVFHTVIIIGYTWSFVQLVAHEPFDAGVLFIVTFALHTYRSAVVQETRRTK